MEENTIVNSWNEWSQLRSIIVGRIDSACVPNPEPMYSLKVQNPYIQGREHYQDAKDKANKQLNHFMNVLNQHNVYIYRPTIKRDNVCVDTPFFQSAYNYFTCPRDVYSVLGNTVLEAPMSWRCRYFDHQQYTPLMNDLFTQDKNMKWVSCPKSLMSDSLYYDDYPMDMKSRAYHAYNGKYGLTEAHPVFDAADIYRCGKDIFVQIGFTTNKKGFEWIKRMFGDTFRVHKMEFENNISPIHIDAEMCIPKPGYMIYCPDRPPTKESLKPFEDANWTLLKAPNPVRLQMPKDCSSSPWISMNILSINESLAVVEENEKGMIELLNGIGVNTIAVPFRDVYAFGGSFHCHTLDIKRDGGYEDHLGV